MASIQSFIADAIKYIGTGSIDGCYFTLSCGGDAVVFPVSPKDFEVRNSYHSSTVNIINLGDINMLGKRGLSYLSIKSFFPTQQYGFLQSEAFSPYTTVDTIKRFAEEKRPCRIAITGTNVNMHCSITDFNYSEQDGTGDVYFKLELKEYRYTAQNPEIVNLVTGLNGRVAEVAQQKEITFYPNMNVMDVAARAVGQFANISNQSARRLQLYQNLVKQGNKISVGSVLNATKQSVSLGKDTLIKF